jgi:hypothetical protein
VPLLLALWRRRELPDGLRRAAVVGFVASPGITGRLAPCRCCWLCGVAGNYRTACAVPLLLALWRRQELPDGSRRSAVVGFVAPTIGHTTVTSRHNLMMAMAFPISKCEAVPARQDGAC